MNRGTFALGAVVVLALGGVFAASHFGRARADQKKRVSLDDAWIDFHTCAFGGPLEDDETPEERLARMFEATNDANTASTEERTHGAAWPDRCSDHAERLRKAAKGVHAPRRPYSLQGAYVPTRSAVSSMAALSPLSNARKDAAELRLPMTASKTVAAVPLGPRPLSRARLVAKVDASGSKMVFESKHDRVYTLQGSDAAPTLCLYDGECTPLAPRPAPALLQNAPRVPSLVPTGDETVLAYRWGPAAPLVDARSRAELAPALPRFQSAYVHSAHSTDQVGFKGLSSYYLFHYTDGKSTKETKLDGQTWLYDRWAVEQTTTQAIGSFGVRIRPLDETGTLGEPIGTYDLARGGRNWSCDGKTTSAYVVEPTRYPGDLEVLARVGNVWRRQSTRLPSRPVARDYVIHCGDNHLAILARSSDTHTFWLEGVECDERGCAERKVTVPGCGAGRAPREVAFLGKDAVSACVSFAGLVVRRAPLEAIETSRGELVLVAPDPYYGVPWLVQDREDVLVFPETRDTRGGASGIRLSRDGSRRAILTPSLH